MTKVKEESKLFREIIETKCKKVAFYTIQAVTVLNKTQAAYVLGDNAIKCAARIGELYRKTAFAKGKSFIEQIEEVVEKIDSAIYWLELIEECGAGSKGITDMAQKTAKELSAALLAGLKVVKDAEKYR